MQKRTKPVKAVRHAVTVPEQTEMTQPRAAHAHPAMPPEAVQFLHAYQVWQQSFAHPAKRQAYIQKICQRIAAAFQPEKIILFGSHAYGQPRPDSDVDLLVVMPFAGGYFHQAARIRQHLGLPIPLDVLVRTPEQLQHRLAIGDRFMQDIVARGKVMYATDHP